VLQCVAVCCSVLQYLTYKNGFSGGLTFEIRRLLQCVAVCCSVLQCAAVSNI